jgi:hypothetical protein
MLEQGDKPTHQALNVLSQSCARGVGEAGLAPGLL